jgi:hypothetical protein
VQADAAIGVYLAELDSGLRAWNGLTLTASNNADSRKWRVMTQDLVYRASRRQEDLIVQLETGPATNRIVAAMALGFVRPIEQAQTYVPALLSALDDPHAQVAANATLALGLIGWPETPLGPIAARMDRHQDEASRTNAALTVRKLIEAGAVADASVRMEVRNGLIDPIHAVVAQSCLILGLMADAESIESIRLLLKQDPPLVSIAAATSLSILGQRDEHSKGVCARALAAALPRSPKVLRTRLYRALVDLSGRNYGDDDEAWMEWAERLP